MQACTRHFLASSPLKTHYHSPFPAKAIATMVATLLSISCLIDGDPLSESFQVEISSDKSVAALKDAIKQMNPNTLVHDDACDLSLWQAAFPVVNDNAPKEGATITLDDLADKTQLKRPRKRLSELFPQDRDNHAFVFVVRSKAVKNAEKRDHDEDEESSSKRQYPVSGTMTRAIAKVGLTKKAVVKGRYNLSLLSSRERVALLDVLGEDIGRTDYFYSLIGTAMGLRDMDIGDMEKFSTPDDSIFPIVRAGDLYIRQTYKELYGEILEMFENRDTERQIVVTGTSGIGKSAFLLYMAIRLLVESDADDPPIILFHTKQSTKCFVFGGCSTVRSGDIEDFKPFLTLPDTWYLVDSSPEPVLDKARTVIATSPKTLFSKSNLYKDVDRNVVWRYYMAPWSLQELMACQNIVEDFHRVPLEMVEELYSKIGGIPRYVLDRPKKELGRNPNNAKGAIEASCERLFHALDNVEDPVKMMQLLAQGKDSLELSSRLVHRWPVRDHRKFRLEWASTYVAEKIAELLDQDAGTTVLSRSCFS